MTKTREHSMLTNEISKPPSGTTETFSIHPREFRNALGRFATGVSVVTTLHQERIHGMTANAFLSVSLDPPLVLLSLDNRSHMHRFLSTSRRYGVSVLAEGQEALSDHFAGRKVEGLNVEFITRREVPLLEGAVAHFVAHVINVHEAGDHTLYIGQVEHFEWCEGKPLLFYAGRYHHVRHHHHEEPKP
jgi:flavin reductase (DIM6/NTAB) family NADH-FMN oxidoreductase RutF